MTDAHQEARELAAAVDVLGWRGEVVGPVSFGGVRFWAVVHVDSAEHARRYQDGQGALTGCREGLASILAADAEAADSPRPVVEFVGALVHGRHAERAIRDASLLAAYTPRAVMLDSATAARTDLVAISVDAAVLDQGLVLVDSDGTRLLVTPGPRVPGGRGLDAREWDLLETVYEAWLSEARLDIEDSQAVAGESSASRRG